MVTPVIVPIGFHYRSCSMPIAKLGDPYVTGQGEVVASTTDTHEDGPDITIGPPLARKLTPSKRRNINDLPIDPKTQTAIAVVLFYNIVGLTDNEISHLVNVPLEDIQRLKAHDAYQESFEIIFAELIAANSTSMQSKIAAFAPAALENVFDIASNAKHELAKLKANQDIMDRAGLHPETLYGKQSNEGFDSLKIVIQDGEDKTTKVDIDIKGRK
jgi:hypothetical protein